MGIGRLATLAMVLPHGAKSRSKVSLSGKDGRIVVVLNRPGIRVEAVELQPVAHAMVKLNRSSVIERVQAVTKHPNVSKSLAGVRPRGVRDSWVGIAAQAVWRQVLIFEIRLFPALRAHISERQYSIAPKALLQPCHVRLEVRHLRRPLVDDIGWLAAGTVLSLHVVTSSWPCTDGEIAHLHSLRRRENIVEREVRYVGIHAESRIGISVAGVARA